jgi:hypothetical protein
MSSPRSVTATFAPPSTVYALAVATAGGDVASDVPGIICGASCVASYGAGVEVTLTPAGSPVVWAGACSGAGACVVPMSRARAVTAAIGGARLSRVPVAVGVTGGGAVASTPEGIACGTTCGATFPLGTRVRLRATPVAGSLFAGWLGSCRGVALTCAVSGKTATAVAATFVKAETRFPLAVTKAGKGTIVSKPAGIVCGATCSGSFRAGATVTLEARPDEGWTFVRWTGACRAGKAVCVLGMDGPKSVSATFGRPADHIAPRVTALASAGVDGEPARLRYRVRDAAGRSRETATVFRGSRRIATIRGAVHAIEPDTLFYFLSWREPVPGTLRFCVTSSDPTGNQSKPSCAPLRIS